MMLTLHSPLRCAGAIHFSLKEATKVYRTIINEWELSHSWLDGDSFNFGGAKIAKMSNLMNEMIERL